MQEFLVLGSQRLTELRDKIFCQSDEMRVSSNANSGYFFIEGVFYDDLRQQGAIEYSK